MENKVVCDYCGTIYDGSREKCPLCGSTTRAEAAPAAPRRRLTEEERKARRRTQQEEQRTQQDAQRARREEDRQARLEERRRVPQKQRGSKAPETQGGIPRGYLRAAVVFLTMAAASRLLQQELQVVQIMAGHNDERAGLHGKRHMDRGRLAEAFGVGFVQTDSSR